MPLVAESLLNLKADNQWGEVLQKPQPLNHAALLPPGYQLQGLDLSSVLFCRTAHELERPRGFLCPFQVPLGACLTFTFCSLLVW